MPAAQLAAATLALRDQREAALAAFRRELHASKAAQRHREIGLLMAQRRALRPRSRRLVLRPDGTALDDGNVLSGFARAAGQLTSQGPVPAQPSPKFRIRSLVRLVP